MLAARSGDDRAAEDRLRESLDQARRLPDRSAAVAALNNLARLLADAKRTGEALGFATEALALGSELGDQHRVAALHTNLADLLHASGQREARWPPEGGRPRFRRRRHRRPAAAGDLDPGRVVSETVRSTASGSRERGTSRVAADEQKQG